MPTSTRQLLAGLLAAVLLSACAGRSPDGPAVDGPAPGVPVTAGAPDGGPAQGWGANPAVSAPPAPARRTTSPKRAGAGPSSSGAPPTVRPRAAGCPDGARLHHRWASWPMPNPPAADLPNRAGYRNLGDGTVLDTVTCLVWQRAAAPGTYDWSAARAYCSSPGLAGAGWRLPSRVELSTLTDFTRANPAIDTAAFPGTPPRFFWTGTPWAVDHAPPYAWMINFYEGLATNAGNTDSRFHVRCVRAPSGSGAPTYDLSRRDQVRDPHTGLVWQRADSTPMTAIAAGRHCASLNLGGHRWRLPSIKELATTVDDRVVAPAIDRSAFPGTAKSQWYWSSSPGLTDRSTTDPSRPWALNYDDGFTNFRKLTNARVRCVR